MKMPRFKKKIRFKIDEEEVFKYMFDHDIKTQQEFLRQAGISYNVFRHARLEGCVTLETAWLLAEFMGVMIEDIIIAEEIKK